MTIRRDRYASRCWDQVVNDLESARVLAPTDGSVLASLCSAYSRFVRIRNELRKAKTLTVFTAAGGLKAHPLLQAEATVAGEMARYASELGLSPTARARVQHLEAAKREKTVDEELDE